MLGTLVSATQEVTREGSGPKITVCLADGRTGTPDNCSCTYLTGQ